MAEGGPVANRRANAAAALDGPAAPDPDPLWERRLLPPRTRNVAEEQNLNK